MKPTLPAPDPAALLAWYDHAARRLPWRVGPAERAAGVRPDPYRVWLSEVMLQQTTVAAVKGYFETFLARWPRLADLADAPQGEVMKAWAGLGYYSRARNLKACADAVASRHDGLFPATEAALRALPGIGLYTAAAIAAIAFDQAAVVVDGNVERVIARLHAVETPLPAAKAQIRAHAAALTPARRPGDFAQAMMDLGATICTPKRPACGLCPWNNSCAAHAAGLTERFPRKAAKPARPLRRGVAYVAVRTDGAVLLGRRADKGLLGGMSEVPGGSWLADDGGDGKAPGSCEAHSPPLNGSWAVAGTVEHTFTHFHLVLTVMRALIAVSTPAPTGLWWSPATDLPGEALPTVMKKIVEAALPGATRRRG